MESLPSHLGSALPSKTRPFLLLLLIATAVLQKNADAYVASPLGRYSTASGLNTRAGSSSSSTTTKSRLNNSKEDGDDSNSSDGSSPLFAESSPMDATTATLETTAASPSFGDVMPLKRPADSASARFGDVVSLQKPPPATPSLNTNTNANTPSDAELLQQRKTRNIAVAVLSVVLAVSNYAWQWTHPVTPIQLLVNMERSSTPLTEIGKNNKPTVIDFWAPWCENCRYMAPTLFQIEESYKDKVNFVMVNGDDADNWPLIEALGVDAIPHLAMVESDGTVDTALIGIVPKEWLVRDIDVLLDNAKKTTTPVVETDTAKSALPFQMLDAFANRQPEARVLSNLENRR